jgi:hypothetical protein
MDYEVGRGAVIDPVVADVATADSRLSADIAKYVMA